MNEEYSVPVLVLWAAGLLCLLLSTFTVLASFLEILYPLLYAMGRVPDDPEIAEQLAQVLDNPLPSLGLSLFNGSLWLFVTIMSVNLLRMRDWCRVGVVTLIGVDLLMTFAVAVYNTIQFQTMGPNQFDPTVTVGIRTTVLEVVISIALFHPAVATLTREASAVAPLDSPPEDRS